MEEIRCRNCNKLLNQGEYLITWTMIKITTRDICDISNGSTEVIYCHFKDHCVEEEEVYIFKDDNYTAECEAIIAFIKKL